MTGSGTLADPYIIWDVNDLQDINLDLAAYYELGQDIDASATVGWHAGAGFIPINGGGFTGHFDGKGYTISGLFINRPATDDVGLFDTANGATIQNVHLINCSVTGQDGIGGLVANCSNTPVSNCSCSGDISGRNLVGGLVGLFYGAVTMTGCSSNGTVTASAAISNSGGLIGWVGLGATIEKSFSQSSVTAVGTGVGGLIGYTSQADINQCFATGNVTGEPYVGGLIGYTAFGAGVVCNVRNCYARGDVHSPNSGVGGLVGENNISGILATIEDCYSTGLVTSDAGAGAGDIGGLVCVNLGAVTDSFWDTQTSGTLISDGGTGETTAQMKDSATFIGVGWGFGTIWGMTPPCNNGYPCLLSVTSGCLWITAPIVSTNPATNIGDATATLNGTLDDDGGEACDCGFEWGLTPALGNTTPTQSGTTGTAFSFGLTGLTSGRTYYFRAFATNSQGTGYGGILSFTTKVSATVMTLPATHITEHAARLHGVVIDDAGRMGEVRFEWGLTREYGMETPWIGGHVTGDEFEYDLNGLTEGTGYHFRAQFRNPGTVSGKDLVFHTLVPLGPVTLIPEDLAYLLEASV